ncbi:MAG: ATP-binding protein [bacterium]
MSNLSLRNKMLMLLIAVVLFSSVPLILIFNKTTKAISAMGRNSGVESTLEKSVEQFSKDQKEEAVRALRAYRTISVLKGNYIVKQSLIAGIIISMAMLIIFLIIGFIFISRITRPLRDLTSATREIAKGNIGYQIKSRAGGELGRLIESFNNMAGDLNETRQQLAMAERRATWQRVARTIAHEIKNPLTPIKLSTERLYDKFINNSKDFPEVIKSATRTILSEIDNLQRLVETFHKYAKFPDPVLKMDSINEIIREILDLYRDSPVKINTRLAENLPLFPLDRGQLREAFGNLIKNSIEALYPENKNGLIYVSTKVREGNIVIKFKDNGMGISAENQKKLFQPYFTTKKQGSGIGLALTERIISLHGGKIFCESESGKGAKFKIVLRIK